MVPHPEEHACCDDGRVLVRGRYKGEPPAGGRTIDAEYVHLFRLHDGRITELRQITDSHAWVEATLARPIEAGSMTRSR